jgi:hypothetical protein
VIAGLESASWTGIGRQVSAPLLSLVVPQRLEVGRARGKIAIIIRSALARPWAIGLAAPVPASVRADLMQRIRGRRPSAGSTAR